MARSTLFERKHLVQTYTWRGVPSTIALTRLTLGFQALLERLWEWETLMPNVTPLPQISHFANCCTSYQFKNHADNLRSWSAAVYDSRIFTELQEKIWIFLIFYSEPEDFSVRRRARRGEIRDVLRDFCHFPLPCLAAGCHTETLKIAASLCSSQWHDWEVLLKNETVFRTISFKFVAERHRNSPVFRFQSSIFSLHTQKTPGICAKQMPGVWVHNIARYFCLGSSD